MYGQRGKGKFVSRLKVKRRDILKKNREGGGEEVLSSPVEEVSDGDIRWYGGRRVVQLGVLAEGLGKCGSAGCCKTLDLQKTVSEKRFGFGSVL